MAWPASNIAYYKSYWNLQQLVYDKGLPKKCFGEVQLEFDYAFILRKLDNLFIYIIRMYACSTVECMYHNSETL